MYEFAHNFFYDQTTFVLTLIVGGCMAIFAGFLVLIALVPPPLHMQLPPRVAVPTPPSWKEPRQ
ncbi:hypothetical protein UFOVP143_36 [uncultured Caudovirales phage]|uniref:Uncharacterized protein n=1 Tax=uncultured Caudovirales phage TaxID=2100421 RepID=A0A6J7VNW5_9CAUD|nr:hypothetical protein UFOVP143_36 [uncultured Caudovirales phage]